MKTLFVALAAVVAATGALAQESAAYLVPIRPSHLTDAYGARWTAYMTGYNFGASDVPLDCANAFPCRAIAAEQAFTYTSFTGGAGPVVVRIPSDQAADVLMEERIVGVNRDLVENEARAVRFAVPRVDQITARSITFLNVVPNSYDMRPNLRIYSVLPEGAEGLATVTFYREYEGKSSIIDREDVALTPVDTNGVRIGWAVVSWTSMERPPFPMRITVESTTPVWGFITITEKSDQPAVTAVLPSAHDR